MEPWLLTAGYCNRGCRPRPGGAIPGWPPSSILAGERKGMTEICISPDHPRPCRARARSRWLAPPTASRSLLRHGCGGRKPAGAIRPHCGISAILPAWHTNMRSSPTATTVTTSTRTATTTSTRHAGERGWASSSRRTATTTPTRPTRNSKPASAASTRCWSPCSASAPPPSCRPWSSGDQARSRCSATPSTISPTRSPRSRWRWRSGSADGQPPAATPTATAAALTGFAGNELVARYRITVGRQIGSAALVADGLHARTDGFTSLAVLLGVAGVALGLPLADPLVGLGITVAILVVLRDAARQVYRRLMDAVDPAVVDQVEQSLRATPGVLDVGELRLRWIGHRLRAECAVVVDHRLSVVDGHRIAEDAEHRLLHQVPRLTAALVHADPFPHEGTDYHQLTTAHTRQPTASATRD